MIKQMKNHFRKKLGVITGVNAKNEKKISRVDMAKLTHPIKKSVSRQNLGVILKAVGLYLQVYTRISISQSSPNTMAGINMSQISSPGVI